MSVAIITGAAGLIGSEAALHFGGLGLDVVGLDNDMRSVFFGPEGSTAWNRRRLEQELGSSLHPRRDLTSAIGTASTRSSRGTDRTSSVIVHTAAQPSHDWAAGDPFTDFDVNAGGTLAMLQAARHHCPDRAVHLHLDQQGLRRPSQHPAPRRARHPVGDRARPHLRAGHPRGHVHRLLDAQRLRRLQGRRGRDGPGVRPLLRHAHGLLPRRHPDRPAALRGQAARLPRLRHALRHDPHALHGLRLPGQAGAGRHPLERPHRRLRPRAGRSRASRRSTTSVAAGTSNCSVLEAITMSEKITGESMDWSYSETNRAGDHIWWIGDNGSLRGATTRAGESSTTSRTSSRRCTTRTPSGGRV